MRKNKIKMMSLIVKSGLSLVHEVALIKNKDYKTIGFHG